MQGNIIISFSHSPWKHDFRTMPGKLCEAPIGLGIWPHRIYYALVLWAGVLGSDLPRPRPRFLPKTFPPLGLGLSQGGARLGATACPRSKPPTRRVHRPQHPFTFQRCALSTRTRQGLSGSTWFRLSPVGVGKGMVGAQLGPVRVPQKPQGIQPGSSDDFQTMQGNIVLPQPLEA